MPRSTVRRVRRIMLFGVALVGAAVPASGQTPKPADKPETIIVTARHRAERVQAVPVSISVVSGAQAAQNNLNNLQDVLPYVAEAAFRTNSTNNQRTLFIRGIGTISTSPGVEASVSTVLDGVVLGRSGQAVLDLSDLAQIEVLSGPQGTLFGKNASAGVINIITAPPASTFHAWAEADYFGSGGNEYRFSGGVTGALTPSLRANLSILSDSFDGNVRNIFSNKDVNGYRREGGRSKFLYQPSDDFDATLTLDYMRSHDTVPNGVFVASGRTAYPGGALVPNTTLAGVLAKQGILPGLDNSVLSNNINGREDDDNGGIGLTLNRSSNGITLTSISAWRIWKNEHRADYDETSVPPLGLSQLEDSGQLSYNQWSQEVRLASPKGGLLDYVAGAYFLKTVFDQTYDRAYAPAKKPFVNTVAATTAYGTESDNEALFGEANINISPSFRLIAGARIVRDGLSFHADRVSSSATPVSGIRPSFSATGENTHFDYSNRLGLQWDFAPNAMSYFTFSRGYKSPAYNVFLNMQASDTQVLKPETNNSFELGLKASLFNNCVRASVAGFIEEFSNYQANFSDLVAGAVVVRLINAGSVSSRGVQGSIDTEPLDGAHLNLNAIYDDAHIDQFNCPANAGASCNVNGQPLPFAPRFKMTGQADYKMQLGGPYSLQAATNVTWQSKTQFQLTETADTIQPAYGIWDARVSLLNEPQQWRLTALVRDITDQNYSSFLAPGNLAGLVRFVPRDAGRYFGIEVRKAF